MAFINASNIKRLAKIRRLGGNARSRRRIKQATKPDSGIDHKAQGVVRSRTDSQLQQIVDDITRGIKIINKML